MAQTEKSLEENIKLSERIESLEDKILWEQYDRKKDNLIVHGLVGSGKPQESEQVAKRFINDNLELTAEQVEKV